MGIEESTFARAPRSKYEHLSIAASQPLLGRNSRRQEVIVVADYQKGTALL